MFIIEGLPAVIWAFFWWRLVDDRPAQVNWLSDRKRPPCASAGRRAAGHQAGEKLRRSVPLAAGDHPGAAVFCWSIGVYGFVLWLPSILKQAANVDIVQAGWLASVPYLAAVLAMVGCPGRPTSLQKRKRFVWPPLLIASIAFYGSCLGREHFWWSYTLLVIAGACMYAPYGPFFAIVRDPAGQRRRRCHGADQQHGRARLVRRLVPGRLPEQCYRLARRSYLLMSGALLLRWC
jgi:hypothetical protein